MKQNREWDIMKTNWMEEFRKLNEVTTISETDVVKNIVIIF